MKGYYTPNQKLACLVLYLNCTPNQKLARFVLYLKIFKLIFWKMIYIHIS